MDTGQNQTTGIDGVDQEASGDSTAHVTEEEIRDSGISSNTVSVISSRSTSSSASSHSPDTQGATGGQVEHESRLKEKVLEKDVQNVISEIQQKESDVKLPKDEHAALNQTEKEQTRSLEVRDSGFSSNTGSVISSTSTSSSAISPSLDILRATGEQVEHESRLKEKVSEKDVQDVIAECCNGCVDAVIVQEHKETASKDHRIAFWFPSIEDKTSFQPLQCDHMEMEKNRRCHVTEDNCLVNTGPTQLRRPKGMRLKRFLGTASTTPFRKPTPQEADKQSPHYFETETDINIVDESLPMFQTILEVGVVEEGELGKTEMSYGRPRSWCVRVGGCSKHDMICVQVYNEKRYTECFPLSIKADKQVIMRFGVVVDVELGRIYIIDLDSRTALLKVKAEFQKKLFPVFGVCLSPDEAEVKMRLISGADINMDTSKEKILYSCMTLQ